MAINTSLLVTDYTLEDVLMDKTTGTVMGGGIVTFYEDTNRTILKNVYMLTGSPGSYTYVAAANPMTLNADGSFSDGSGNNIKLYYYPYDETQTTPVPQAYYVTVVNSDGVPQFTRQNFPFLPSGSTPATSVPTLQNYIINNRFWNNLGGTINVPLSAVPSANGSISINGTTWFYTRLAPSQHDGHSMPDIMYIANTNDGTQTVNFNLFPQGNGAQTLTGDITPEYYLDYSCTVAGTATAKYIQIPISLHLLTLANAQNCTMTVQANNVTGTNNITLGVFPFAGTGVTSPAPSVINTFSSIGNAWQKYPTLPFTMPNSIAEASLGVGGDDAFYLQIGLPTGQCRLQIALPSFFLSSTVPTNDFATYDQVDAIANSPRTGDWRQSLNSFIPYGWVSVNGGSIGSAASLATNRAARDTWQLYNLLWNNVNNTFAPVGSGRGANAYTDFSANKVMTLPFALGAVLMGIPIPNGVTYTFNAAPTWNSGITGYFTVNAGSTYVFYPGAPVILSGTLPSGGPYTANTVYYCIPDFTGGSSTQFQLATTYANAISHTAINDSTSSNNGSNIVVNFALAASNLNVPTTQFGQVTHLLTQAELPSGNLTGTTVQATTVNVSAGGTPVDSVSSGGTQTSSNLNLGGSSNLINLIQPSVYTNIYLKL